MTSLGWSIDSLISDSQVPREETVVRNPVDIESWKSYLIEVQASESFKKQVFVLERAVSQLPLAEELWTSYLDLVVPVVAKLSFYHHKRSFLLVNRLFNRALLLLQQSNEIWERYLDFLVTYQKSEVTVIRRKFNQALLHLKDTSNVWEMYLDFADFIGGRTGSEVYHKYLQYLGGPVDAGARVLDIIDKFVEFEDLPKAAKVYESILDPTLQELPKSQLQLLNEYLDILEQIPSLQDSSLDTHYEQTIIKALATYPDQLGPFYVKLAQFMTSKSKTSQARHYYNQGLQKCTTVKDFIIIYDSWTQAEETELTTLSERLVELESEEGESSDEIASLTLTLDFRMDYFEKLINDRPFLLNDMMLRQDINNLDHWFQRIVLHEQNLDQVLKTYALALTRINPLKAHSTIDANTLTKLWVDYAKVYSSKNDWKTSNLIFSKSVTSQFKSVNDLVDLYIEWSESTLSSPFEDADSRAVALIEEVLQKEKVFSKADIHTQVHKSVKLWSFYIDLLESFLEDDEKDQIYIDKITKAYTNMIDLKIASPKTIIGYASFLQSIKYFEKSFGVYELGLKLFQDSSVRFEIWNIYLSKAIELKIEIERIRALFDGCLDDSVGGCPAHLSKPFILLYSKFEQDHGFVFKAIKILKDGIKKLSDGLADSTQQDQITSIANDKLDIYQVLFSIVSNLNDVNVQRTRFEEALNDTQLSLAHLAKISSHFIQFEVGQNEINRARALFKFTGELSNPSNPQVQQVWSDWENFELDHGNESTFKDMLRFKREVNEKFAKATKFKENINPMGFVKGSTPKKTDDEVSEEANPDQIDLDM